MRFGERGGRRIDVLCVVANAAVEVLLLWSVIGDVSCFLPSEPLLVGWRAASQAAQPQYRFRFGMCIRRRVGIGWR